MASLEEIREAMAANLSVITDIQTSAYRLGSPTPPACHIYPDEGEYDIAVDTDQHVLRVQVLVGNVSDIGAQKQLDAMIGRGGERSIKTKLETRDADQRMLGGACDDLIVTGYDGYGEYTIGGITSLGAVWRVEVITTS